MKSSSDYNAFELNLDLGTRWMVQLICCIFIFWNSLVTFSYPPVLVSFFTYFCFINIDPFIGCYSFFFENPKPIYINLLCCSNSYVPSQVIHPLSIDFLQGFLYFGFSDLSWLGNSLPPPCPAPPRPEPHSPLYSSRASDFYRTSTLESPLQNQALCWGLGASILQWHWEYLQPSR